MTSRIVVKILLVVIMFVWVRIEDRNLRIIKNNTKNLLDDDYQLWCLEGVCKINDIHLSCGTLLAIVIIFKMLVIEPQMSVICNYIVVILIILNIIKGSKIGFLILGSVMFDRSRDYKFYYFSEWVLSKGKSDFFELDGKFFDVEESKQIYKNDIQNVMWIFGIEYGCFYLLAVLS